jgi:3-oxoacyl-[acyl-carrier protein] reductase
MAVYARPEPKNTGRTVVVTGGAGGIGKAIVEAFRNNGDTVAVLDRHSGPGVTAVDVADEQA